MQILLDFAPLLAFMVAYYLRDVYAATAVLMIAMAVLLLIDYLRTRRVPVMHLVSALLIWALGSATLILRNAQFIQWKPTIFLWILALALLASAFVSSQPLAQRLLSPALGEVTLPRGTWLRINLLWVGFYGVLGAANLWVARHLSERAWVNFKVIGLTALTLVFFVAQALWLSRRAGSGAAGTDA